jgi:octopine/nopaline transport system permease protein
MSEQDLPAFALLGFGTDGWGRALVLGAVLTLALSLASMTIGSVLGALLAWARDRAADGLRAWRRLMV